MERVPTIEEATVALTVPLRELLVFYCGGGDIEIYAIRSAKSQHHAQGTYAGYELKRYPIGGRIVLLTNEFVSSVRVGDVLQVFGHTGLLINKGGGIIQTPSDQEFLEVTALHIQLERIKFEEERQRQQQSFQLQARQKLAEQQQATEVRRKATEAHMRQEQAEREKLEKTERKTEEKARRKLERLAQVCQAEQETNPIAVAYRLAEKKRIGRGT